MVGVISDRVDRVRRARPLAEIRRGWHVKRAGDSLSCPYLHS